jgi:uncharacterized protein YheU (UPF0270 family)
MAFTRNTLSRILTIALILVLAGLVGIQASASPVVAQELTAGESQGMSVQVYIEDGLKIAEVGTTPVFEVGDTFKVSIVAENVEEPGIFGGQFELDFDTDYLNAVEDSLVSGEAMKPVVNPINVLDNEQGIVRYAASRQGSVDNLLGDVVLATLSFEAMGATEPPEGQTTTIHLTSAKLGAKGGIEVPVAGLVDLEIIIREGTGPGQKDIVGNVKVEGRADDNQAGHQVMAVGELDDNDLMVTTDANGDFLFDNAPADTYTLTANRDGFLAATCADVVHGSDLTTLDGIVLLAGDIAGDDGNGGVGDEVIDITDAVAIGGAFGSTASGEVADLNADEVVDVLDLILMAANFGQTSVDNPWVCQQDTEL